MPKQKSITVWDVAKQARVSGKTVSRVINGEPMVDADTRRKVQAAMAELGYTPNIQAQRLRRGRSHVIGLLFRNATWAYLNDVLVGTMEIANQSEYTILPHTCDVSRAEDRENVIRLVDRHSLEGIILTPPTDNSGELLDLLQERKILFVRLTPHNRQLPFAHVTASDFKGAGDAVQHLIQLGHRRIGHIIGDPTHQASHDRLAGYQSALDAHGIPAEPALIRQGDWTFQSGKECAYALLRLANRPTAIFAGNDDMAAGTLAAAHCLGLAVPAELSIIGFDDVPIAQQVWPPLTTVRQPIYQIALLAAQVLIGMIQGKPPAQLHSELPTELIVRDSTAPPGAQRDDQNCG